MRDGATSLPSSPRAPGQPSASRDLWREAIEDLPKRTQQKLGLQDAKQGSLAEQIEELSELVKKKQQECEQKFWKFRVGDHEYVLRDYAVRIVDFLQKTGDIVIPFAPPQASIPWSLVKAVMKVCHRLLRWGSFTPVAKSSAKTAVDESAQMCALLASIDRVIRVIARGQVYERIYTAENVPKSFTNLQSALLMLYGACLELLANSSELFAKSTAQRTGNAILHAGETVELVTNLDKMGDRLKLEVQACQSESSAVVAAALTDLLRGLDAPLLRIDQGVSTLLERIDSNEQVELLKWISSVPYRDHHNTVKEARTSDTCEWLLRHERFREWEDTSSSVVFWLQGSRKYFFPNSCSLDQ